MRLSSIHGSLENLKARLQEADSKAVQIEADITATRDFKVGISQEGAETHQQMLASFSSQSQVTSWLNIVLGIQLVITVVVVIFKLRNEKDKDFNLGV
jgi:hypothetical protein